jgi:hypothetical protein
LDAVAYAFLLGISISNRSEDIRRILREACDSVGVRLTNPKPDEISIARPVDVVAIDSFVGPKT